MKGALKLGVIAQIPIYVHWSFSLILLSILYVGYSSNQDASGYFFLCIFFIAMFTLVVMHEFGHSLTARRFGVSTRDIILSPIGGVARLEEIPKNPWHEFLVAVAGPAVNVVLALIILPILLFVRENGFHLLGTEVDFLSKPENILPMLFYMNTVLAVFNMIPAFPMDGGRVLRALLSIKMGRLKATRIASIVGQLFAVAFLIYGIYASHFVLPFIAVFIFLMARSEYKNVRTESIIDNAVAKDLIKTKFTPLAPSDKISRAISLRDQGEKSFLIMHEEEPIAVLHELFLVEAMEQNDTEADVLDYKSTNFEKIKLEQKLKPLIKAFQNNGYSIVPVYDDEDKLVGTLDIEAINNFINEKTKSRFRA